MTYYKITEMNIHVYVLLNRINSIYVLIYCPASKQCLIPVSYLVILRDVVFCITRVKSTNKKQSMIFVLFVLFTVHKKCISNDQTKFECQLWSYKHDTELTVLYYVNKARVLFFGLFRFKIPVKYFFKLIFYFLILFKY